MQHAYNLLWSKIAILGLDECWPWQASTSGGGYGCFNTGKRHGIDIYAHRAVFELTRGVKATGLYVCHKCDNPVCCNPAHLFLGTPQDNAVDMCKKGRWQGGKTQGYLGKVGKSYSKPLTKKLKLSDSQIFEILIDSRLLKTIASEYGVTPSYIGKLKNGKTSRLK